MKYNKTIYLINLFLHNCFHLMALHNPYSCPSSLAWIWVLSSYLYGHNRGSDLCCKIQWSILVPHLSLLTVFNSSSHIPLRSFSFWPSLFLLSLSSWPLSSISLLLNLSFSPHIQLEMSHRSVLGSWMFLHLCFTCMFRCPQH